MIIISTFNPDAPRSTTDEELLTTLLCSLIIHRVYVNRLAKDARNDYARVYNQSQLVNADRLIEKVYPLLGLQFMEVHELIKQEEERWRTETSGKS